MIPRLVLVLVPLAATPLVPAPPASAQAGSPERRCGIVAHYAFLLASLRDDGVPADLAAVAVRRTFSPDPANLPSERNAAALVDAIFTHPDVTPDAVEEGVRAQCLEIWRARG